MIASIRGTLLSKSPTDAVVDVQGVGYGISIPLSTSEVLGPAGSPVTLYTHLHVREDLLQLFGFATVEEREMFLLLIGVNGIGPRLAIGILSGIGAVDLLRHLAQGNATALTAIPGIGRKLADRLVLELHDRAARLPSSSPGAPGPGETGLPLRNEALLALLSLGYARQTAEKAVQEVLREEGADGLSVEQVLKSALRRMSS